MTIYRLEKECAANHQDWMLVRAGYEQPEPEHPGEGHTCDECDFTHDYCIAIGYTPIDEMSPDEIISDPDTTLCVFDEPAVVRCKQPACECFLFRR